MCYLVRLSVFLILGPLLAINLGGVGHEQRLRHYSTYFGTAIEKSRKVWLIVNPAVRRGGRRFDNRHAPPANKNQIPGDDKKPFITPKRPVHTEAANFSKRPKGGPDGADSEANRFSTMSTTAIPRRTIPHRVSLKEDCDYLAYYCLKAYKTGKLCGRTLYYNYQDFENYCMLDYVNCMERYEVWQVVHMGECFNVTVLTDYQHYEYHDDSFLDQTYVIQE